MYISELTAKTILANNEHWQNLINAAETYQKTLELDQISNQSLENVLNREPQISLSWDVFWKDLVKDGDSDLFDSWDVANRAYLAADDLLDRKKAQIETQKAEIQRLTDEGLSTDTAETYLETLEGELETLEANASDLNDARNTPFKAMLARYTELILMIRSGAKTALDNAGGSAKSNLEKASRRLDGIVFKSDSPSTKFPRYKFTGVKGSNPATGRLEHIAARLALAYAEGKVRSGGLTLSDLPITRKEVELPGIKESLSEKYTSIVLDAADLPLDVQASLSPLCAFLHPSFELAAQARVLKYVG